MWLVYGDGFRLVRSKVVSELEGREIRRRWVGESRIVMRVGEFLLGKFFSFLFWVFLDCRVGS